MLKKIVPIGLSFLFASQAFSVSKSIMNCSRDQRPVDGILTQYEVIQDEDKTYSLHHTVGHSAWPNGPSEPTTEVLLSNMKCTDPGAAVGRIALVCKHDQRHVGGALEKLTVVKNARGTYALELYRAAGTGDVPTVEKSKKILDKNIKCTFTK